VVLVHHRGVRSVVAVLAGSLMPDWLDTTLTWGIIMVCVLAFLALLWRRPKPARCPDCQAFKGMVHKAKCQYLVKQSGG
jgi:hypothetical protein